MFYFFLQKKQAEKDCLKLIAKDGLA